jgi:gamma-glutamylaminecyclotransferase
MTTKVFVYGTLKKGFSNHSIIMTSPFVKEAATKPEFTMITLGGFPGILANGNTSIIGEVYEVSEFTLDRLDKLEGHPNWYRRTPITLLDGDEVETYIYLHKERTQEIIDSGFWDGTRKRTY